MNYSNHASRLQLRDPSAAQPPQKLLSLEPGRRGLCLRTRTVATMARRKFEPYRLSVAAALAALAFLAPVRDARAQLGYDPFAANASHTEERWATYSDAATDGTNRPSSTFINGVNAHLTNATAFNFGVTAPNPSGAFLTSGNNIYSPTTVLTLALSSTYAPAIGSFNTIVFSLKTLGNLLDTTRLVLTPNGGQAITPRHGSVSMTGSGMGASAQYAFQFDLSGIGGSNNFSITVPGSASSVSFSSAQLDATTTVYGAQSVVLEPSSLALMAVAFGGLSFVTLRRRVSV